VRTRGLVFVFTLLLIPVLLWCGPGSGLVADKDSKKARQGSVNSDQAVDPVRVRQGVELIEGAVVIPSGISEAGESTVALAGVVLDRDGVPAPEGLVVHAQRLGLSRDTALSTTTGLGGVFELRELNREGLYEVWGVASGIVTEVVRISPALVTDRIKLRAGQVWVAQLDLIDAGTGSRISRGTALDAPGSGVLERFESGALAERCPVNGARLVEAGVTDELVGSSSVLPITFVAWSGFSIATPPRSELTVRVPGFHSRICKLEYVQGAASHIPTRLVLDSAVDGWGTVEVLCSEFSDADIAGSQLRVRLVRTSEVSSGPRWMEFPLSQDQGQVVAVEVPVGIYRYVLKTLGREVDTPGQSGRVLHVVESRVARLAIDTSDLRRVDFALSDEIALEYSGPFSGTLRYGIGRDADLLPFYFPGPPYTFIGLPEGEYSLMVDPPVMFPRPADPASAGAKFRVGPETAGIVHDLEVVF
jgi:hypothetical protein